MLGSCVRFPQGISNPKRCLLVAGLVFALAPLLTARQASATNFYVDASCSIDGNGRADQCATSAGGAGAWNGTVSGANGGVQNCFNTLVAGDTCFIKNGTYRTTWLGNDYRVTGGFHPANSGTATNKITYRAYPGHRPVLINCTDGAQVECSHQTVGANGQGHIVYDGLTVIGAFYLLNTAVSNRSIEIKNCDVSVGWFGDGNWAGIYLEKWDGNWIHHNYIHDIVPAPGAIQNGTGVKQYTSINTIVEYNTIINLPIRGNGIDAKYDAVNNTFRYNYIANIDGYGTEFNSYSPQNVSSPGSGSIYGNVFNNVTTAIAPIRNISGLNVYNNTFYNIGEMYYQPSDGSSFSGFKQWNNIVNALNTTGERKLTNFYGPAAPNTSDYNVWQSGFPFSYSGTLYQNLAAVQSARGLDLHSQSASCSFVNPGAGDFHLQTSSSCKSAGRVGGTTAGTVVEVGAYGVTSCVGHTCGGSTPPPPPPTPPAAPANLRIVR
jgi:hypothetical protein